MEHPLSLALFGLALWLSGVKGEVTLEQLQADLNRKQMVIGSLSRQLMLNQFQDERRISSEGQSGIVEVRNYYRGSKMYHSGGYTGSSFAAMHDHLSYTDTVGLGEITAVLNGVQFQTRHNDYTLRQPSRTSKAWHATDPIPPPPVPQSVLDQRDVQGQISEMQEYFLAFKEQNSSRRDYKPYFTPVLCYLEGTWLANYTDLEEVFPSRVTLNGHTWPDLQEKARYSGYMGTPFSRDQGGANLPTRIMGVDPTTQEPVFAQWHYRILCHPTGEDIPTSYLHLIDDMAYRVSRDIDQDSFYYSRAARFILDDDMSGDGFRGYGIQDRLISRIPGLDNTPGNISERQFIKRDLLDVNTGAALNLAFYNSMYKESKKDGMNRQTSRRGFNDPNLYVALTTQPEVAPLRVTPCDRSGCRELDGVKASWMIPLEVIYLTPLLTWNPYQVTHHEGPFFSYPAKYTWEQGSGYPSAPYNGTTSSLEFRTPYEFFSAHFPMFQDESDFGKPSVYVMDPQGQAYRMSPSGVRTVTPSIGGIGEVRLRYPIAPVHSEGSPVYKELRAYQDYINDQVQQLTQGVKAIS